MESDRSLLRRRLFRFTFCYLLLTLLPFPLYLLPGPAMRLTGLYMTARSAVVTWFGRHLLHIPPALLIEPRSGSGDTTVAYVTALCFLAISLIAAAVWLLLDRKNRREASLHDALRIYVRYGLAAILLDYGIAKVIPSQMPPPALDRLLQPIGQSSPMGLLWTFVVASPAYINDGPMRVALRRVVPPSFLLKTRGFRWINERPYNR